LLEAAVVLAVVAAHFILAQSTDLAVLVEEAFETAQALALMERLILVEVVVLVVMVLVVMAAVVLSYYVIVCRKLQHF
jgi:hypothetical protein